MSADVFHRMTDLNNAALDESQDSQKTRCNIVFQLTTIFLFCSNEHVNTLTMTITVGGLWIENPHKHSNQLTQAAVLTGNHQFVC